MNFGSSRHGQAASFVPCDRIARFNLRQDAGRAELEADQPVRKRPTMRKPHFPSRPEFKCRAARSDRAASEKWFVRYADLQAFCAAVGQSNAIVTKRLGSRDKNRASTNVCESRTNP